MDIFITKPRLHNNQGQYSESEQKVKYVQFDTWDVPGSQVSPPKSFKNLEYILSS